MPTEFDCIVGVRGTLTGGVFSRVQPEATNRAASGVSQFHHGLGENVCIIHELCCRARRAYNDFRDGDSKAELASTCGLGLTAYDVTGFFLSGEIPNSAMACCTTSGLIFFSSSRAFKVASTMNL